MNEKINIFQEQLKEFGFTEFSTEHAEQLKNYTFLLSVHFLNNMHTIYFYEEKDTPDNLVIEFVSLAVWIKPFRLPFSEIKQFISELMLPGLQIQPVMLTASTSWSRPRTKSLLVPAVSNVKSGLFYIGLDSASTYSDIYHSFMSNSFLSSICVNEAGEEGGNWTAAQFRTAYSGSFMNYEGADYGNSKEQLLYFISYSYIPSKFGINYLTETTLKRPSNHYPEDMPLDLVLAIDALNYTSQVSTEDMLRHIEQSGEDALFYTYVLLVSRGIDSFWIMIPRILKNKNPEIIEWLQNYFSGIENQDWSRKLEQYLLL